MRYSRSLFIFRRDLRLEDNTALDRALALSGTVAVAFIFDPRQVIENEYFSRKAYAFMLQSLEELEQGIARRGGRLFRFFGEAAAVVESLVRDKKFDAVFINKDYTPFSARRDLLIRKACEQYGAVLESMDDALLTAPGTVMKPAGGPYTVFTPFYRRASAVEVVPVRGMSAGNFFNGRMESPWLLKPSQLPSPGAEVAVVPGGRRAAEARLGSLGGLADPARDREIPAQDATTHLSAYLKFGIVSVREVRQAVAEALGPDHPLIRQLYWRDFFTHIAYFFPHVFTGAFYPEYDALPWENDPDLFAAWCNGTTGVPLVDAGMRELNATGLMHNRVRMITASFLVKDLHIDWRRGEQYFARHLVDYDPAVNNGNWQWAASTGCDHQPYFRIFNPDRQQQRFDPEFRYIRRWVPEFETKAYPAPVVCHADTAAWSKNAFAAVARRDKNP